MTAHWEERKGDVGKKKKKRGRADDGAHTSGCAAEKPTLRFTVCAYQWTVKPWAAGKSSRVMLTKTAQSEAKGEARNERHPSRVAGGGCFSSPHTNTHTHKNKHVYLLPLPPEVGVPVRALPLCI